jgi:hypothetical protein
LIRFNVDESIELIKLIRMPAHALRGVGSMVTTFDPRWARLESHRSGDGLGQPF